MAVKSIVDIEVNDAAFRNFQTLWNKYQTQLAKTPAMWAAAGKEAKGVRNSFEAAVAALLTQAEQARRLAKAQKEANELARSQASHWRGMARNTREVAGNIARATKELLKWTALTSVFTGVVGAGGLFGIDRLAANVSSGRRSSTGLGVSYGQQRAFELNYGRVVDPGGLLGGVNEALSDVSKRTSLVTAGLSQSEMQGGTAATAVALIDRLKQLADSTPQALMGNIVNARGLGQFGIGVEDMNRLKAASPAEMANMKAAYGRDAASFGLSGDTQRVWQDFAVQMKRAGENIENVFVTGLKPLVPGLEKLSASVAGVVKAFLGTDTVKSGISAAAEGLDAFAKYVGTPKFQSDIASFANGIGVIGEKMAWLMRKLGYDTGGGAPAAPYQPGDLSKGIIHNLGLPEFGEDSGPSMSLLDRLRANSGYQKPLPTSVYVKLDISSTPGSNVIVNASQVAQ